MLLESKLNKTKKKPWFFALGICYNKRKRSCANTEVNLCMSSLFAYMLNVFPAIHHKLLSHSAKGIMSTLHESVPNAPND